MYVLFYSSYCKASSKFLQALEKTGETIYFNKICVDVDNNGVRPGVVTRYNIKKVPSIIADGTLYSGIVAFKWFHEKIKNNHTNTGLNSRENKKIEKIKEQETGNNTDVYEFKKHKQLIDEAEVIGDINDVNIPTPDESLLNLNEKKINSKKDILKNKQANNIYSQLQDERKKFEKELKNKKYNL